MPSAVSASGQFLDQLPAMTAGGAALGAGFGREPAAPGRLVCPGLLRAEAARLCARGAGVQPLCAAAAGQRGRLEQPCRHPPAGMRSSTGVQFMSCEVFAIDGMRPAVPRTAAAAGPGAIQPPLVQTRTHPDGSKGLPVSSSCPHPITHSIKRRSAASRRPSPR